jgi:hypothetical protein
MEDTLYVLQVSGIGKWFFVMASVSKDRLEGEIVKRHEEEGRYLAIYRIREFVPKED